MIWLEETQYCLRIVDADPATKPPYRAVGSIYVHSNVAIIVGFHGSFMRADVRELFEKLHERNIKHLLSDRADNHRVPFGQKINAPGGPFDGWWHIDLEHAINLIAGNKQNRSGRIPEILNKECQNG
ncbi:MAG: hypothetical protein KF908_05150 [Nitrosomonas sp.]|nr:hypothetical protein [Nitrosomonas sp.]